VVVSDFLGPINWDRPLRAVAGHHDVLGVEVLDPRDMELPAVGEVVLRDAESGQIRELTVTDKVRADFARAAEEHRRDVQRALRQCGAPTLALRTDRDWIADVVRFIAQRRRGMNAGATR
jgi:uncharacterized protein (DUF58 family)